MKKDKTKKKKKKKKKKRKKKKKKKKKKRKKGTQINYASAASVPRKWQQWTPAARA